MQLGPNVIGASYQAYTVLANMSGAFFKPGGVTIDWTNANVQTNQGTNAQYTLTITGGAGTFTVSVTVNGSTQTTGSLAFNATTAVVEDAIQTLSNVGNGNAQVGGSASNYTLEFVEDLRATPITTVAALGSGGATATPAVVAVGAAAARLVLPGGTPVEIGDKYITAGNVLYKLTPGTGQSKYGVADNTTSLVRGESFMNDSHIVFSTQADQVGTVFEAGTVILSATQIGGTGKPSLANFLTAFPGVRLFKD